MPEGIQYLDPEIANEGAHADSGFYGLDPTRNGNGGIPLDGEWAQEEVYQPFIDPPRIPDYSFVKVSGQGGKPHPLLKYFPQFSGRPYRYQPLPVVVYHPKHEPRTLKTVKDAEKHGLKLAPNKLSLVASGEWQLEPVNVKTFDPEKPGAGKSVQTKPRGEADIAALIAAAVGAAMAQLVKPSAQGNALASDPDFAKFQAFKAWQAAGAPTTPAINLTPKEERAALAKIAGEAGIKVKDNWGLDKIKAELDAVGQK